MLDCPDSTQDQSVLDWTPSRISASFGQYENSSSWYVNMSWSPMNGKTFLIADALLKSNLTTILIIKSKI